MFTYSLASFSSNYTCNKCSLFAALEAKIIELDPRLHTLEKHIASQAPVASVAKGSIGH